MFVLVNNEFFKIFIFCYLVWVICVNQCSSIILSQLFCIEMLQQVLWVLICQKYNVLFVKLLLKFLLNFFIYGVKTYIQNEDFVHSAGVVLNKQLFDLFQNVNSEFLLLQVHEDCYSLCCIFYFFSNTINSIKLQFRKYCFEEEDKVLSVFKKSYYTVFT